MKVKFRQSVPTMAYFVNDVAELDSEVCAPWIESGHMLIIPETEGDSNNLPDDLPSRTILFNEGFTTIEDIVKIRESLETIKGITKASAAKIKKYIDSIQ